MFSLINVERKFRVITNIQGKNKRGKKERLKNFYADSGFYRQLIPLGQLDFLI